MTRLQEKYNKVVIPELQKAFKYPNVMAVPKINKVVINIGVGRVGRDKKVVEHIESDLMKLTGQKPSIRTAKKSIAGFKLRQGSPVGIKVTLRGNRMYDFIDRYISIALPRSRDFRGIDPKNIDTNGNLNVGVVEHNIFPEITYESVKDIFGLQITVSTTAKTKQEGQVLLSAIGFPFKKI